MGKFSGAFAHVQSYFPRSLGVDNYCLMESVTSIRQFWVDAWHSFCSLFLVPVEKTTGKKMGRINMNRVKVIAVLGGIALLAAEALTAAAANAELRVRCERRGAKRSRVSIDGNNLPAGIYTIALSSGGNAAPQVTQNVVAPADEFEADYDSNPADIRAGATAISRAFIVNGAVNVAVSGPVNVPAQNYSCVSR